MKKAVPLHSLSGKGTTTGGPWDLREFFSAPLVIDH